MVVSNSLLFSPRKLGRWSNLTNISPVWLKPPTRLFVRWHFYLRNISSQQKDADKVCRFLIISLFFCLFLFCFSLHHLCLHCCIWTVLDMTYLYSNICAACNIQYEQHIETASNINWLCTISRLHFRPTHTCIYLYIFIYTHNMHLTSLPTNLFSCILRDV